MNLLLVTNLLILKSHYGCRIQIQICACNCNIYIRFFNLFFLRSTFVCSLHFFVSVFQSLKHVYLLLRNLARVLLIKQKHICINFNSSKNITRRILLSLIRWAFLENFNHIPLFRFFLIQLTINVKKVFIRILK